MRKRKPRTLQKSTRGIGYFLEDSAFDFPLFLHEVRSLGESFGKRGLSSRLPAVDEHDLFRFRETLKGFSKRVSVP